MRERHFFVFFFSFLLLLLRYVKFFSHIRTKMSSNKVELTHGGAAQRFIRFYFSYFSFCFRISKGNPDREDRCLPNTSFLVSFVSLVVFLSNFYLDERKRRNKAPERVQNAVTAPFPTTPSLGLHPRAI